MLPRHFNIDLIGAVGDRSDDYPAGGEQAGRFFKRDWLAGRGPNFLYLVTETVRRIAIYVGFIAPIVSR
jgi:hypothetical protein